MYVVKDVDGFVYVQGFSGECHLSSGTWGLKKRDSNVSRGGEKGRRAPHLLKHVGLGFAECARSAAFPSISQLHLQTEPQMCSDRRNCLLGVQERAIGPKYKIKLLVLEFSTQVNEIPRVSFHSDLFDILGIRF